MAARRLPSGPPELGSGPGAGDSPDELFGPTLIDTTVVSAPPFELAPGYTGRAAALRRLQQVFQRAVDGSHLAFVLLVGEPGMGKSRTLRELAQSVRETDPDVRVLLGAADATGVYSAFSRLFASRFGILPAEPDDDAREKIIAGVSEVLPAARVTEVAHLIAHLLRVPFPDSAVVTPLADQPQALQARSFIAIKRFLEADASAGPLVLCLENLEESSAETINLLHYLVAGLESSPVVLLGTARESLFDLHPSFGDCDVPLERIELGPLSASESAALMRDLCAPLAEVPPSLIAHAQRLGGSPRALFELTRLLLESEVIASASDGSWRVDPARLHATALPASHEAVVAARVQVMDPAERDVLQKAAATGETFWIDPVVALVRTGTLETTDPDGPTLSDIAAAGDHTKVMVSQILAKLAEREWLVEVDTPRLAGEREFRFAYPYLWSTVYDGIDDDERAGYHHMVAQWRGLRPDGRGAAAQEEVGRHLELAGDGRGAAACYRRAAVAARESFFNDKAIRLFSRALACLGEADLAARMHIWHDLGSVYELKGEYEAALGGYERMLRLAWTCASRAKAAVAFNKMGRVWRKKGALELALDYLERGHDLFEQAEDGRGIAASLDDIGKVLYLLGRYDEAYEKVTDGLAKRGKGGDPRSIARSLSNLGNIQQDRGRIPEAYNCHREALELRRTIGDRAGVVMSQNNLAVLSYERGDLAEAGQAWEQALGEAEQIGALPLAALCLCNLGELARRQQRNEEARRRLSECLEIASDLDNRRLQVEATRNLALLEHSLGHSSEAQAHAERAHDIARTAGLRDYEGRALLTLAEVHGGALFDANLAGSYGDATAEGYFRRGVDLLAQVGNESELAKGLELYGRYKIEHGEVPAGRQLLTQALAIFTRLGMGQRTAIEALLASL